MFPRQRASQKILIVRCEVAKSTHFDIHRLFVRIKPKNGLI